MTPDPRPASHERRHWSVLVTAVIGGIAVLVAVAIVLAWNYPSGERSGWNPASILSIGLSLVAIVIALAIYSRQRTESEESAARHTEMLEQVRRSASRTVQLATTEQMLKTAQQLRHLTSDHIAAHQVAQDLLHASDRVPAPRVLWVDDVPGSVELEIEILRRSGMDVDSAECTDQAMAVLGPADYDIIISDMGRGTDQRAGYDLLERVQGRRVVVPVVFYTGSDDPAHSREARTKGALGSTNDPVKLFKMVLASLNGLSGAELVAG